MMCPIYVFRSESALSRSIVAMWPIDIQWKESVVDSIPESSSGVLGLDATTLHGSVSGFPARPRLL